MTPRNSRRRIAALVCVAALALSLSGIVFIVRGAPSRAGRVSHLLFPGQWGFSSGTVVSVYYNNGVPSRTERYAYEKHGYYEFRTPCDQTTPCK